MRQVGHLPELYEDARSEKYIKKNTHRSVHLSVFKGPRVDQLIAWILHNRDFDAFVMKCSLCFH